MFLFDFLESRKFKTHAMDDYRSKVSRLTCWRAGSSSEIESSKKCSEYLRYKHDCEKIDVEKGFFEHSQQIGY